MSDSITRRAIMDEATRRGWKFEEIGTKAYFLKVTLPDGRWEMFRGSQPMRSSANGGIIGRNKDLSMDYFQNQGYQVAPYLVCTEYNEAAEKFLQGQGTIVAKPSNADSSKGVTTKITTTEQLKAGIELAARTTRTAKVVLQKQMDGKLYRVVVVNGSIVAAAYRKAPTVVGNGMTSIGDLITQLNKNPLRGDGKDTPLNRIKLKRVTAEMGDGFLEQVPGSGKVVKVSHVDSISVGGESQNVTDQLHADWQSILGPLTDSMGLFVCGYDIICEDISIQPNKVSLPILEANSIPGTRFHLYPSAGGEPINIMAIVLDELFK